MKKVFTIVLLTVFFFGIIGWQWMYLLKLSSHQTEKWGSGSFSNSTNVFVFNSGDKKTLSQTYFVNDHELIHEGKLFDIKKVTEKDGWLICYCERDGDEETILSSFDLKTKDSFDNSFSGNSKTQKVVKLSLFEKVNLESWAKPVLKIKNKIHSLQFLFHSSAFADSFFVPPDAA